MPLRGDAHDGNAAAVMQQTAQCGDVSGVRHRDQPGFAETRF